ncbi:MAG: DUF3137 domain-containing protein [Limisphaerales bacterium]
MSLLRTLFGPSKDEIWQQFAAAVGGRFAEGGFWNGSKVEATHGQWTVTLDTYTVSTGKSSATYTRMRAPYVNPDGFQFKIYRENIFSNIGKLFGLQDVTVGYQPFDDEFIIKGNNEGKLRKLFADEKLRGMIERQPNIYFCLREDEERLWRGQASQGVSELYFQVGCLIKDIDRLKQIFDIFSETLDQLCRMGPAYEQAPNAQL